jgi:glutamate formiminotransferase/formiminotetrahydrofolate cyclodeaminase
MEEAVSWSEQLAERVSSLLHIPVYLYEHSARQDYRRALPDIRKGQYEGLFQKLKRPEWQPDYGSYGATNETAVRKSGAAIIGARDILVAFNISLDTRDEKIAGTIAQQLRTSGYHRQSQDGQIIHHKGLLPAVRAIGWYLDDFECAQVSMNLLDYRVTSPLKVWETCRSIAARYNTSLVGCEVVGLIPEACVKEAGLYHLGLENSLPGTAAMTDKIIRAGISYLGLDKVKPFNPDEKILEYALRNRGLI